MQFKEIMVKPLDMNRFNESLKECEMSGEWGICLNPPLLVNTECIGFTGDNLKFSTYRKSFINEDGRKCIPIVPEYMVEMKIQELEEFAEPEVLLFEFMNKRFNYNDRIKSNQREIVNYINGGK